MRHGNGVMRRSWGWEDEDIWRDRLGKGAQVRRRIGDEMKKGGG